ncbi:MAG: MgtC/SapB family protein [Parcubacteria group bacterium]|nr:MgtC/SapB family protein [Parcubacteria group bacterium]
MEIFIPSSTLIVFGQLLLATFLGMLLGTECSVIAGKGAGTRTFALVALGACLFTVVSVLVTSGYIGVVNFDPMRLTAGVITGIGFLGAGVIIFRDDMLKGLTTAAGLWVSAAIGVSVGFGLYSIAIFTTFLTLLVFTGIWFVENNLVTWTKNLRKIGHLKFTKKSD